MIRYKKIAYIILLIIYLFIILNAKNYNIDNDFNTANLHYAKKEIDSALKIYLDVIKKGYDNFEINYNIGCCYYNLNQLGKARFYFEKALYYKPFDSDLFHNLTLIYRQILKNPSIGEQVIMNRRVIFFIPSSFVIILMLFFIFFSIIFLILTYKIISKRRLFLIFFTIFFFFTFSFTVIFFVQYNEYYKKSFIVTSKIANIYVAPDEYETILSSLQEGASGEIIEEANNYIRVKFNNGLTGWIDKKNIISAF